MIPIVIGTLGTVSKGMVKGLEELGMTIQEKTIQMRALLRSARILRRVPETWDLMLLILQLKTISWCWRENLSTELNNNKSKSNHAPKEQKLTNFNSSSKYKAISLPQNIN